MAKSQHVRFLHRGVAQWNKWRNEHPLIRPLLSGANLHGADLSMARLHGADLIGTKLSGANLRSANLSQADLRDANLSEANLRGVYLYGADLHGADIREAGLERTVLQGADVHGANITNARFGGTHLGDLDLSVVHGLTTVEHQGPSTIGIDTIYRSRAQIPDIFMRGCGVPETFIEYMRSLVVRRFEYYSCFISYSHHDAKMRVRCS